MENTAPPTSLSRFAWLSVAAAISTIALKMAAYHYTGSIGLLSDAIESLVNLAGAVMALAMLTIAARPADEEHAFGHNKAEYFSSGFEGALILIAAISIIVTAIPRLITPQPIEQLGFGIAISVGATAINLAVALVLLRAGRRYESITLDADARHLLTDVWTTAGVIIAIAAVRLSGWLRLDPIVAILVAINIVWAGIQLMRKSVWGLMDRALPQEELEAIRRTLAPYLKEGVHYHALRTRQAGSLRFISVHILVPGEWPVHQGHQLLERIEADLRKALPSVSVLTHLESLEDPAAWADAKLDGYSA
jgi:cation diffusion facilitator family transporter